jgi:hypothetical protein
MLLAATSSFLLALSLSLIQSAAVEQKMQMRATLMTPHFVGMRCTTQYTNTYIAKHYAKSSGENKLLQEGVAYILNTGELSILFIFCPKESQSD